MGRHAGHFVKISLDEFWLFTTVSNGKRINRDQTGQSVSVQVKSISKNRVASTELPKKTAASQIIGPASSTLTKIGTAQHRFIFSSIYETICLYFLVIYLISHPKIYLTLLGDIFL